MIDLEGLEELVEIRGASGNEGAIKQYILDYVGNNQSSWKTQPTIIEGEQFQDALILVFGQPRTAIFAHMDTIGFMVGYENKVVPIGGPRQKDGIQLVGKDKGGEIETELMVLDDPDGGRILRVISDRILERGTDLTFKPNFRETEEYVQSPYMDNRLGVWVALQVCKTLEHGAVVFSTYEEQGGGSVGFLGKYLIDQYKVRQALISDITWVTEGIKDGRGVAVSLHDKGIPRKSFVNKIRAILERSAIAFQLEVESSGGSDGTMLQQTDLSFDWCFIGAPEQNVHTPDEIVHKGDIKAMLEAYQLLMKEL